MGRLLIKEDRLVIRMSPFEKLAAVRGDVVVPLTSVTGVSVEEQPYRSLRGVRSPGAALPGVIAYGVWRSDGSRHFVALHGSRAALALELGDGAPFASVTLTVDDAAAEAEAVRLAAGLSVIEETGGPAPALADDALADEVRGDDALREDWPPEEALPEEALPEEALPEEAPPEDAQPV